MKRLLIAGIGNVFLGDDAFGVEVVRRLGTQRWPDGVRVVDFGIRGFDLACALVDGYDGVILVDAVSRSGAPGTLFVLEPAVPQGMKLEFQGHSLTPEKVLALAGGLGEVCRWIRLVGCEPLTFGTEEEPIMGLSPPVEAAVEEGMKLVERLVKELDEKGPDDQDGT